MEDPKLSLTAISLASPEKSLNLFDEQSDNFNALRHEMQSMMGFTLKIQTTECFLNQAMSISQDTWSAKVHQSYHGWQ
jgi:hypothetical protein